MSKIVDELQVEDWDTSKYGNIVAIIAHILYIIARINLDYSQGPLKDIYMYIDYSSKSFNYIASTTTNILSVISILNFLYTFSHKRCYHLFEKSINTSPRTSSARRVKINLSQSLAVNINNVKNDFEDSSHESTVHLDSTRDIWEIAMWNPNIICLRVFCLFSPGHILIYWLFSPTDSPDSHPGLATIKLVLLQTIMSVQIYLLESHFTQKAKNQSIIHGSVMKEYDIKYVHPQINRIVQDTGTQYDSTSTRNLSKAHKNMITSEPSLFLNRKVNRTPNSELTRNLEYEKNSSLRNQQYSSSTVFTTALLETTLDSSHSEQALKGSEFQHNSVDPTKYTEFALRSTPPLPDIDIKSQKIPFNSTNEKMSSTKSNEVTQNFSNKAFVTENIHSPTTSNAKSKTKISIRNFERGPSFF